jgi:hypothetical protein
VGGRGGKIIARYSQLLLLAATIGFESVLYNFSEGSGSGAFVFRVLQGNITFPVGVLFSTSDGSALGKHNY